MQKAVALNLDDISVGQSAAITWEVSSSDIDQFALLSGDYNPLHMNDDHAKAHGFDNRVAHGFLLGAKISGLIGMYLPGKKCLLLDQKLAFPNPIYVGDNVTITAEVISFHHELGILELKIKAHKIINEKTIGLARGVITCKILS
jgi:3-hydroxybutyryl-CoA dehydratase